MASPGGNNIPPDLGLKLILSGIIGVVSFALGLSRLYRSPSQDGEQKPGLVKSMLVFCYSCFIKPHSSGPKGNQQDALESFYSSQADVYDVTRSKLLKGREDMLALAAAQLLVKAEKCEKGSSKKRIWVDVGGGTGWNIEAMSEFVNVPEFFSSVYLVDFSPSLCSVARKRFARLGWTNVKVICEDARKFRLEDHENGLGLDHRETASYFNQKRPEHGVADLITMSYSLSMIPDFYSVIDSLTSLLSPDGVIAVVDFYTQSKSDVYFRNYTGGSIDRHVNFLSRAFWRSWFDLDRVSLEPGRRDYLEYRFGSILTTNSRNYTLGAIPYYVWLGCHNRPFSSSSLPNEIVERIDAFATESPYIVPVNQERETSALSRAVERSAPEFRSKAFDAAIQNLSANLPLPSFFYQNHHWRIFYDDRLKKHTQFNDEYIYAFTWEDSRVDRELLNLGPDDVVLAITSAGDNILSYATQTPARIHAIDLNPAQNHLLELKVAAFTSLSYQDLWKMFGEGKHAEFRSLLISKLSPHLSSRAFQYWLSNAATFTSSRGRGLYDTGGSKHAIRVFRWVSRLFNIRKAVHEIISAASLDHQRQTWHSKIRPALLSRIVSGFVVSSEAFLWAALGVPKNQLAMIETDHAASQAATTNPAQRTRAHAIWHYMVNTLDPVIEHTHITADNPYYLVCLQGQFSRHCHPDYLSPAAHEMLSQPGAFDGLRIHTDELEEVIARITPGTLTVAVIMDSMDWFDQSSSSNSPAAQQIMKLNRALKMGGKVLLRSAALTPWYVEQFKAQGFSSERVGHRVPGACIDRVNMYASCWVCTKVENLRPPTPVVENEIVGVGVGVGEVGVSLQGTAGMESLRI